MPAIIKRTASYKKRTLLLIAGFFIFRCIIASFLELGNDEAYYWLYSQKLQWNYFDHPPIVAVWAKLFTANLLIDYSEFFLRSGSIIGCALSAWFLYKTVALLHSERAGFFAACLYNASFYAGLTAGIYLMPDSPQMVFWTFSLWMIARISLDENNWTSWVLLGIAAGLCIMSKIHGAFIWVGMGSFILLHKRNWLAKPQLYVAFGLTLLIISPIIIWNIQYDFITYQFHSKRVTIDSNQLQNFSLFKEIVHQFFWNNPFNVVLILWGLFSLNRRKTKRLTALSIYQFIGLPLALILLFFSIFRDTILIHWNGPAYVSLLPVAAIQLANINKYSVFPRWLQLSIGTFIIVLVGWALTVHFYPGTWGSKAKDNLGHGDISLDLFGWREAANQFNSFYKNEVSKGAVPANTPLICTYWWGAHVEYYFARPLNIQMIGLGEVNALRHYWWVNDRRKNKINMALSYLIIPSDENHKLPFNYYDTIELATIIEIKRNNRPAHNFRVYRLKGWNGELPAQP